MIEQSLNSRKALPSGLTFSSKNRSRYILGCRRWKVAALIASEGVEEAAIPHRPRSMPKAADQSPPDHRREARAKARQLPLTLPFPTPMTLRLGTLSLPRAFRQQSLRYRRYSVRQLPGDYSVVLPKEPFVLGVSHIVPRPVPVHISRPPYIKGGRPILDDPKSGDPYEGDGRIVLGSPEEQSLRKAALLARDALNYAATLTKVISSLIKPS